MKSPILDISGLSVSFKTDLGVVRAAEDVSLTLYEKETLALVGETGCGKSVVASGIMKLLPKNAVVEGQVIFSGRDLFRMEEKEISRIRGNQIAMIFQNPSLSLNPVLPVGDQIAEPLQVHRGLSRYSSLSVAERFLSRLGMGDGGLLSMYPFQFSGGMNQRVMIATSMILSPKIIIADEPTKGLDASLARDVAQEIGRMKDLTGSSLLLITHDLMLAKKISDRVAVMYCGEIVETGKCNDIFEEPLHPYTKALLDCLPERGCRPIEGSSPSMISPPQGCKFHPRCPQRLHRCTQRPVIQERKGRRNGEARQVRCWLY